MGWAPPLGGAVVPRLAREAQRKEAAVSNARTTGLDLAKNVFQAHGADEAGEAVFRKRLRRDTSAWGSNACRPPTAASPRRWC